uniref:Uncharacterized protein n=1 Tax=Panagrolaimus davidi TaxID=227884 RepID=A0A914PKG6_9BILA
MATKNDKNSFIEQSFETSENQYSNLNLNQGKKCPILVAVPSNSKPNNDKYCVFKSGTAATDFKVSDNFEEKEELQSWNKSFKVSTFTTLNEDDLKKQWKNENTLKTINKSTHSLHIAAYENSIEIVASDLFGNENSEGLKKEKLGSIKKRCFTGSLKSRVI